MVESNNTEERLARIEQMVETLQRDQKASRVITMKLALDVAALAADTKPPTRRSGMANA